MRDLFEKEKKKQFSNQVTLTDVIFSIQPIIIFIAKLPIYIYVYKTDFYNTFETKISLQICVCIDEAYSQKVTRFFYCANNNFPSCVKFTFYFNV